MPNKPQNGVMEETTENPWGDCAYCGDEVSEQMYRQFLEVARDLDREPIHCGDMECTLKDWSR